MRLIIFSILEYNEKLIYYFVSRGARWAGVIILEYNDIIGENIMKKKGTRRSPISLSVNLVFLMYNQKYASKEEKC